MKAQHKALPLLIILALAASSLTATDNKGDEDIFEDDYDIGCNSNRPALCPDGNCYEDYSFCQPLIGCTSLEAPIMCPSGQCALSFASCNESSYACEVPGYTRCVDGVCRLRCTEIHTNGCPVETPFYCPSGKCVKNRLECTGSIIRFSLFLDEAIPLCRFNLRQRRGYLQAQPAFLHDQRNHKTFGARHRGLCPAIHRNP